jgi:hypothetical protein
MQRSQGQDHQPPSPEGAPRAVDVRLGQDRLGHGLESGTSSRILGSKNSAQREG